MHHVFLNEFIFWTQVKEHEKYKAELLPKVYENLGYTEAAHVGKWKCDVNTEFFKRDFEKYFSVIVNVIYPALDEMFLELRIPPPKKSTVSEIWYNHYECGSNQEVHTHSGRGNLVSGIYMLELNEPNKTVFFSSLAGNGNVLTPSSKQLTEAVEGSLILFPSALPHYVLNCEKARTTVAFNITCEY